VTEHPSAEWTLQQLREALGSGDFSMQRRQGILALRLSDIRDDGIHVAQLKRGAKVVIEWADALRAAVRELRTIKRPFASVYLITNRSGQRYSDRGFKAMWNRLQVAWKEVGGERLVVSPVDDLRQRAEEILRRIDNCRAREPSEDDQ
jgi:hypothetical protein